MVTKVTYIKQARQKIYELLSDQRSSPLVGRYNTFRCQVDLILHSPVFTLNIN